MESSIKKRDSKNLNSYHKDDIDIAYKFAGEIKKEVGKFIKAIVLFGSTARKKKSNDIDLLIILDDVSIFLNTEFIQTYRIIVRDLVIKISKRLHVTTFKFTSFWEYARNGDPVAINILRDGVPLIDTDFFRPLQLLLYQGRIRPTPESMWSYFYKAPNTLSNSLYKLMDAHVDLYWAVIDSAHAVLMKMGEIPPSPSHVAEMLQKKLIKKGLLEEKYGTIMTHFYELQKQIEHRDKTHLTGKDYDMNRKMAEQFVDRMKRFIEK